MPTADHGELPTVTVIVPVYQGEAHIGECLDALQALDYPAGRLDIVVVDNNSTDRTVAIARAHAERPDMRFPLRVEMATKQGACCARNRGLECAEGDLIAFTDSDCIPDPAWLRKIVPHFQADPKVGGCGGPLVPTEPQTVVEEYVVRKGILSAEYAMTASIVSPPFLVTANAVYRKKALDEVGGMDENLTVNGEDADLAWRVRWKWHKIEFEPEALVLHKHRSTLLGMMRQVRSYGAGSADLFAKHRKRLGLRYCFYPRPYTEILLAPFKTPFALVFGKTRLDRVAPILDFLNGLALVTGKIGMSLKRKVWFL